MKENVRLRVAVKHLHKAYSAGRQDDADTEWAAQEEWAMQSEYWLKLANTLLQELDKTG